LKKKLGPSQVSDSNGCFSLNNLSGQPAVLADTPRFLRKLIAPVENRVSQKSSIPKALERMLKMAFSENQAT
jgi:hypothetical protein